ncbi:phage holin family protein [Leifsonia poae]|uniref:phage holin family protein n=1 Tax=Leifsonia poae TaxID=110933 RepID=UPI001CBFE757|nr:phage holin family protein [Leifsonia poae]
MTDDERARSRSLFALIGDLPRLLIALLKAELDHLKTELAAKAKYAGVGIGLFAVAGALLFFALGVFVAAAVLGLAVVLPAWLAALIVAVALLIIAAVLVLIGVSSLKRMNGVAPQQTIASIREDTEAFKGMGKYDN